MHRWCRSNPRVTQTLHASPPKYVDQCNHNAPHLLRNTVVWCDLHRRKVARRPPSHYVPEPADIQGPKARILMTLTIWFVIPSPVDAPAGSAGSTRAFLTLWLNQTIGVRDQLRPAGDRRSALPAKSSLSAGPRSRQPQQPHKL